MAEPGSGAEELARLIHDLTPGPSDRRFVSVPCRGLAPGVIENQLFGEGTGGGAGAAVERARSGTLFIDEVGDLGAAAQVRLSDFIEAERRAVLADRAAGVVRVVAATQTALDRAVHDRMFGLRLYEQLAVVTLRIPPLRERQDDIVRLARQFLESRSRLLGKNITDLEPAAITKLCAHPYPRNVQELAAVIERAVIVETGPVLRADSISFERPISNPASFLSDMVSRFADANARPPTLEELERAYIVWLLERTQGNRTAASRILGVSYPTVAKKIIDYKIDLGSPLFARRPGPSGAKKTDQEP